MSKCHPGDTIDDMVKICLVLGLLVSVLWIGYQQYGLVGLVHKQSRGRHCARGRSHLRTVAQHRNGTPVRATIEASKVHMLPSRYYPVVGESRRGIAHAA